jgi:hypothetical protein
VRVRFVSTAQFDYSYLIKMDHRPKKRPMSKIMARWKESFDDDIKKSKSAAGICNPPGYE